MLSEKHNMKPKIKFHLDFNFLLLNNIWFKQFKQNINNNT